MEHNKNKASYWVFIFIVIATAEWRFTCRTCQDKEGHFPVQEADTTTHQQHSASVSASLAAVMCKAFFCCCFTARNWIANFGCRNGIQTPDVTLIDHSVILAIMTIEELGARWRHFQNRMAATCAIHHHLRRHNSDRVWMMQSQQPQLLIVPVCVCLCLYVLTDCGSSQNQQPGD